MSISPTNASTLAKLAAGALLLGNLCGCQNLSTNDSAGVANSLSGANRSVNGLSADKAVVLGVAGVYAVGQPSVNPTNLGLAVATVVAAHVIYDPLAPNWRIEESLLSPRIYQLALQAKSFRTGGDGEASLIVQRRAQQLQRASGASGYRIREYSEGIESSTPFTQRYATGVVELLQP